MPHGAGDIGRIHCRKCGYDLRAQAAPYRCPECGTIFNPANRRTYRTRPPRWAIGWWVKRAILLLMLPVVLSAVSWAWLYWGWLSEQAAMEEIRTWHRGEALGGERLKGLLGEAGWVLDRIRHVELRTPTVDDDLVLLKEFGQLRELHLSNTQVTDAGLVHVIGLKKLRELDMYDTQITDAGLIRLKEAKGLTGLYLGGTRVTDAGLVYLKDINTLQELGLESTQIMDAGLAHLKEVTRLHSLFLQNTRISDSGMVHIGQLTALQTLDLSHTPVTDAGLVHLKELANLRELHLSNKQATDAALAHMRQLSGLKDLKVWDAPEQRKLQLQAALPGVTINRLDKRLGGFGGGG